MLRQAGDGYIDWCIVPTVNSMLVPLLFFLPATLAAYRAYALRALQHDVATRGALADLKLAGRVRRRTSTCRFVAVLAASFAVLLVVTALRAFLISPDEHGLGEAAPGDGPVDCTPAGVERAISTAWIAGLVIAYTSSIVRLRGLDDDVFLLVTELRVNAVVSLVCLPVWWALGPTAPLRNVGATVLHPSAWSSLWACTCVSTSVIWPALLTWSSRYQVRRAFSSVAMLEQSRSPPAGTLAGHIRASPKNIAGLFTPDGPPTVDHVLTSINEAKRVVDAGEELKLGNVLEVPRLRALFTKHLEKEFCSELVAFYHASREDNIARDAARLRQTAADRRNWIVDTYIRDGAVMQVNISGSVQKQTIMAVESGEAEDVGPVKVFRRARLEVYDLLQRAPWRRFLESPEGVAARELVSTLSVTALRRTSSEDDRHAARTTCCRACFVRLTRSSEPTSQHPAAVSQSSSVTPVP